MSAGMDTTGVSPLRMTLCAHLGTTQYVPREAWRRPRADGGLDVRLEGTPTIVVRAPKGMGATLLGSQLASYYGKARIVDDWHPSEPLPVNAIVFTSAPISGAMPLAHALCAMGSSLEG